MNLNSNDPLQDAKICTKASPEEMEDAIMDDFGGEYSPDGKKLVTAHISSEEGEYVIKEGVEIICDNAFDMREFDSIIIPNSVIAIGEYAFSDCDNLESIVIPDSVVSIGDYAFDSCSNLKSVVIPESVISIGSKAFAYCTSLESIKIPKSVKHIGEFAFRGDNVTELIVESPNYICEDSCLVELATGKLIDVVNKDITSCKIPESATSIVDDAFKNFESLERVVIPNSVTSIGKNAFYGCRKLREVVIPASVIEWGEDVFENDTIENFTVLNPNPSKAIFEAMGMCCEVKQFRVPAGTAEQYKSLSIKTFHPIESYEEIN